jgi:predicted HTH transcriptional regulator
MTSNKDIVLEALEIIEKSIITDSFREVESQGLELKDLSTGEKWKSLQETICAFLNTSGGFILCGIRERDNRYIVTGFDRNNESKLIDIKKNAFKDFSGITQNVEENISFYYNQFLNKTIAIIHVLPLSYDKKYLSFESNFYQRILTQDKTISKDSIIKHQEYKAELEYSKEIQVIGNAEPQDLDVEKINQFILKINASTRKETLKKDIIDASDFLKRRYCLDSNNGVTVLGALLFSKDPFHFLEYRAEVDCYFETGNNIGRDKKIFQNDVLTLMEDAFSFVWGHIKVGRSFVGGGQSDPEFPEKLIREVINNAFAHRDYVVNKFITIKINPGDSLEIINPGAFKQKMIIRHTDSDRVVRRIISGVPETKNPKLANVLKVFDRIESQGIGMATLTDSCLENIVDIPYFDLSNSDMIRLVIPSGKLLDEEHQRWIDSFRFYISKKLKNSFTNEHALVLTYLFKTEKLNQKRLYTISLSHSNNHFDVLNDLKQAGLILEHPIASSEQNPVYIVSEELLIEDYSPQISHITGKSLESFDKSYLKVLNFIYRHNYYNQKEVKPSQITPELYLALYGKKINPTQFESLGRKVRKICTDLEKTGFLHKVSNRGYKINEIQPSDLGQLSVL